MAAVRVFAVALVVVHEGRHLGDGGGRVGGGAHGAVVLPPLAPLRLVLHPLSLQSRLHLEHTHTHTIVTHVSFVMVQVFGGDAR